jgi:hypothetical protein
VDGDIAADLADRDPTVLRVRLRGPGEDHRPATRDDRPDARGYLAASRAFAG